MKDYEKAAIAIGATALGIAGYQAYKTKQATDAIEATDPAKNPVSTAVDLAQHTIGGFFSWLNQRFDDATGRVKGKSEEIIDTITSVGEKGYYVITGTKDKALDAVESGTKYIWGIGANAAKGAKENVKERLTNNPFTLMGAIPEHIYVAARKIPHVTTTIYNILTGVGSKKEETTKKTGGTAAIERYLGYLAPPFGKTRKAIGGHDGLAQTSQVNPDIRMHICAQKKLRGS